MKLVTWNIQWGRGADGRVDLERILAHARRLADFDVLCLQEVSAGYPELPGCDGADQFRALAERLPEFTAIAGVATDAPRVEGERKAFGNMILFVLVTGFLGLVPTWFLLKLAVEKAPVSYTHLTLPTNREV